MYFHMFPGSHDVLPQGCPRTYNSGGSFSFFEQLYCTKEITVREHSLGVLGKQPISYQLDGP